MPRPTVWILLLLAGVLAAGARAWNVRDVFVDQGIYFLDADCYSRMTRVKKVLHGEGLVIRHHDFENWPQGTIPHTTAPFDWMIVGGTRLLDACFSICDPSGSSVLKRQTMDLAGALISPLLGAATCIFLGGWARAMRSTAWLAVALFCAVSPILVHGTVLGRPDHQSLQILLMAMALGAELTLTRAISRAWGVIAGLSWALGLWVSLYEPAVLLAITLAFWLLADRRRFIARELRLGWICFAATLLAAWLIEGWRISWPGDAARVSFARWELTIGELSHLDPRKALLYRWLGAGIVLAPFALLVKPPAAKAGSGEEPAPRNGAWLVLLLLAATFALTMWQVRWGYFLAIAYAVSLPWLFQVMRRAWISWPVFLLCLWPLAQDWDEKLFPDDHPALDLVKHRGLSRLEAVRLREVAGRMVAAERLPFLAPWWLSPALAYWSGQPGVAGSSHQSLPGIIETAKFFTAGDAKDAGEIVRRLGVQWVVTDEPERLLSTSHLLLGDSAATDHSFATHLHEAGEPRERATTEDLRAAPPQAREGLLALAEEMEARQLGSNEFTCTMTNDFYKLFRVKKATLPP